MRRALVGLLLLTGCVWNGPHPLHPLEIPTVPYRATIATRLAGTLTYDGGCLLFRSDTKGVQLVPIWPDGTIFNGTSVIFHRPGRMDQTIVINEEFLLSGQPVQWARLPGPRIPLLHQQCGGIPFAVASVRPAD